MGLYKMIYRQHGIVHGVPAVFEGLASLSSFQLVVARKEGRRKLIGNRFVLPHKTSHLQTPTR